MLTRVLHVLALRQIVRHLREELQLLQEPGSYVAEVVKLMGKTKVLVKVNIWTVSQDVWLSRQGDWTLGHYSQQSVLKRLTL